MSASTRRGEYKCAECGRGYLRSSHLQRHQVTHSTAQRKECPFCHRQFFRSDVLLRHSRACKHRDTREAPQGQRRGRKRISCDRCSQTHTLCDGDLPCETCLVASVDCSYNGLKAPSPSSSVSVQRRSTEPAASVSEAGQGPTSSSERISIPFILKYTDQSSKSSFDLHCMLGGESSSFTDSSFSVYADPFPELWSSFFHAFINPSAIEPRCNNTTNLYGLDDSMAVTETMERLISHLQGCDPESPESQLDISAARSFFCPPRLGEYVHSFFDHSSHTNCVIHRASFNVNTASTHLLLVVCLLGAVCTSPEDAMAAQTFSDIMQRSFIQGPEFKQILYSESPQLSQHNVQIVQAAMLMMVLQSAREGLGINRRIRNQFFPALVSIIRSLNLTRVVNDVKFCGQPPVLEAYICQETLVRTMAWAYLQDSYSVVFYRSPPQFRIIEADFGLPRNDPFFDAMDPVEYELALLNTHSHYSPSSLKSIVQRLMDEKPIHPQELIPHVNTLFALSLILSALHSVLFDIQALESCIDTRHALIPVERALDRWKELYDILQSEIKTSKPSKAAFMIHSLEFWWLAKQFVRHPDVAMNHERFVASSIKSFHAMVQDLKGANTNSQGL